MSMFNPDFDPLMQLEIHQAQIDVLNNDKRQLVIAINHQATALRLLNQQVAALIEKSNIQDDQIKLLQAQIQNVSVIQLKTLGK